jgi:hypothetical protein
MNHSIRSVILLSAVPLLILSCASFLRNDESAPAKNILPYSLNDGVQVWDDSTCFPFGKASFIDEIQYVEGATFKELEDKALFHAKAIKADGIYIYKICQRTADRDLDVGRKRGDLDIHGFNLEDHGAVPDTLHFGKTVKTNLRLFEIHVRFFVYNSGSNDPGNQPRKQ